MTIKFGLFLATTFPAEDDMETNLDCLVEETRFVRDAGFASLWAGNHYLTYPLQMPQSMPLLARLIPEAAGMLLGSNILVLPVLNPVQVAEEAATMDLLTGGRYVLGVGLGYRDDEFSVFNVPKRERVERLVESITLIRRLFNEPSVVHEGRHFVVRNLGLSMSPKRLGGPPIWIAASTDPAIKRAAAIGDAWLITFYPSLSLLREQVELYRAALRDAGKGMPEDLPILKECYIGRDRASALEECRRAIKVKYDAYASWGQDRFLPSSERFDQPFEEFVRDRFLIGDAGFVRDEIARYHDLIGVNHFIVRVHWPGLEHAKVMRTLHCLAEEVMPGFA